MAENTNTERDYPQLPDFDAVEQHIYGACRRYIDRDMLAPIHNLIRDAIDADRKARASLSLPAAGDELLRQIVQASDDGDSDTHLSKHFYDRIMSHIQTPSARPVTPLQCPKCSALWLHWPAEQTGFGKDTLNCRSEKHCDYCEKAGVEQLQRLERVPATLHAPSASMALPAAGQEPVADAALQNFESPRAKILMRAWQEGWEACRDSEYVGEDAQNDAFNQSGTVNHCVAEDILYAAPQPAVAAWAVDADPLQGAANWLNEVLVNCNVRDIQHHLFIGYNRAKRLHDAALAAQRGGAA